MLNPTQIIEAIQEDAPCVYNILLEIYHNPFSVPYKKNRVDAPTPEQLLKILTEYSDDNYDVHYWNGRYAQMLETDKDIDSMIELFETNRKTLAPLMDHEYNIKIDLLNNVQEFLTTPISCQPL